MLSIVLFGLAAAVYPQLLAVVLLILTLPNPRLVLWVCCAAAILTSFAVAVAVVAVFRSRGTIAGTSATRVGPLGYIGVGLLAILIAWLIGTEDGRALFARYRRPLPRLRARQPESAIAVGGGSEVIAGGGSEVVDAGATGKRSASLAVRERAAAALADGSLPFAAIAGVLMSMPGAFDVLAAGHLARSSDSWPVAVAGAALFVIIKLVLIEVPSVAYLVDAEATTARTDALARWLQANKLRTLATFLGLIGVLLVVRGVVALF